MLVFKQINLNDFQSKNKFYFTLIKFLTKAIRLAAWVLLLNLAIQRRKNSYYSNRSHLLDSRGIIRSAIN